MLLHLYIHNKTTAGCEIQLQLRQEGSAFCWLWRKPLSGLPSVRWWKKGWAVSTKEQINHSLLPVSQDQIHFHDQNLSLIIKAILRKHPFTQCFAAGGPGCDKSVNLSVVGDLGHRKHIRAIDAYFQRTFGFWNHFHLLCSQYRHQCSLICSSCSSCW